MRTIYKTANLQKIVILMVSMTAFSSLVVIVTGAIGDYAAYLEQWVLVTAGLDPWSPYYNGNPVPFNAYGPLHAAVGSAVALHSYGPKFIFALCSLASFVVLIFAASRTRLEVEQRSIFLLALLFPLSPLVIVHTYAYGGNDIVCALLCILACELRARNMFLLAGMALGLGALMKFYPLLFAPFFCIDRNGIARLRPLLAAACVFALGMLFCHVVLGWSVLSAVEGGVTREAKSLSILRFAQVAVEYTGSNAAHWIVDFLIDKNSLFVLVAVALVSLWGWIFRVSWRVVTLIGILAVFAVYKVGHTQFFIVWSAVIAWALAEDEDQEAVEVSRAFFPLLAFLWLLSVKSAALALAYSELPEFSQILGKLDYQWRTLSSLVFWAFVVYGLIKARSIIFAGNRRRPAIRV
ncbi:MAG: glycosyltransferase family 87 protein [Pseudomonadota bacterium]